MARQTSEFRSPERSAGVSRQLKLVLLGIVHEGSSNGRRTVKQRLNSINKLRAGSHFLPQSTRLFPTRDIVSVPHPLLLTRNPQQVKFIISPVNFRIEPNFQLKMSVVSSMDESTILKPFTQIYESAIEAALYGFVQNMNTIIKAPQEAVDVISEVSYMVYRALALTDDVIDNSKFRKKVPTANEVFGAPRCLNASWISFFMAIEKLLSLKQPKAVELLVKNIKMMYIGQAMEIVSREAFECPTEEECDEMAFKKTGGFLLHITELLQLFAQDQRDLTKLNKLLGIFYGAHDDLEDLHTTHIESYSEDTNDGKFGFPLVIAINRHPRKLDKCEIAAGMADKASRWSYIQTLLKESDALVRCQEILSELEAEIRTELDAVGGSDIADYLLSIRL